MDNLKQLLIKASFILGVLGIASTSHAILLEPIVGVGKTDYELGSGNSDEMVTYYGARVGTSFLGITWAALDYRTGSGTFENVLGTLDIDYDRTMLGLVVGIDLPLIRAWVGYNFQDKIKFDPNYGTMSEAEGPSVKAGVGLGIIPFIEISLEFIQFDNDDTKVDTLLLNASVPLNL